MYYDCHAAALVVQTENVLAALCHRNEQARTLAAAVIHITRIYGKRWETET